MSLKKTLKLLDKSIFNQFFLKSFGRLVERHYISTVKSIHPLQIRYHYIPNKNNPISILCDKYGSDKGTTLSHHKNGRHTWNSHSYADLYFRLFNHCRNSVKLVFECGIGSVDPEITSNMGSKGMPGASLRVWRDYFPNATIYGADIDSKTLFQADRILTHLIDQTNRESIINFWSSIGKDNFDLILDDGLHTFEAGTCLFENSFNKLREGGIYIIEDINPQQLVQYINYFKRLNIFVDVINLLRPSIPLTDNSVIVISKGVATS
jgi:hypothetical protein